MSDMFEGEMMASDIHNEISTAESPSVQVVLHVVCEQSLDTHSSTLFCCML